MNPAVEKKLKEIESDLYPVDRELVADTCTGDAKYLLALVKRYREALEDFRDHGTRHDITPTGMFKDCGCFQSLSGDSWQGYIQSQDASVRNTAAEILKFSPDGDA